MTIKMDPDEARSTVKNSVCSDCWGPLIDRYLPKEGVSEVTCTTKDCSFRGVVSMTFVAIRMREQHIEAVEARFALREVLNAGKPKKTAAEAQKELYDLLGFEE